MSVIKWGTERLCAQRLQMRKKARGCMYRRQRLQNGVLRFLQTKTPD